MSQVMLGALAMGFGVAGLFFLRFWRDTRDRLFGFFALAFFVLAASRVAFAFYAPQPGGGDIFYWIRFAVFAIIVVAILDKNRSRGRPKA
jgi:hypothetical protein